VFKLAIEIANLSLARIFVVEVNVKVNGAEASQVKLVTAVISIVLLLTIGVTLEGNPFPSTGSRSALRLPDGGPAFTLHNETSILFNWNTPAKLLVTVKGIATAQSFPPTEQ
jgi:hypothetical protein